MLSEWKKQACTISKCAFWRNDALQKRDGISISLGEGRIVIKFLYYFWMGNGLGKACQLIFRS